MADLAGSDSGLSSPPSSPVDPTRAPSAPPSECSMSDLSSLASTPDPPDTMARLHHQKRRESPYPTPPASQQTSLMGSPTPDGAGVSETASKDGPPPAKRRRLTKGPRERTTEHLDLRSGSVDPEQQEDLARVLDVLHKRQKVVVIAGAGMSVAAGIPDFRSENGLFRSLKDEYKLKGTGKDLFDASVYKDDTSTLLFHNMVSTMSRMTKAAKPTTFHHMLATMAKEGRLLRLYTQNVDGLDTSMEPLSTRVPLTKDDDGKWPRTVQLHGGLDKMVCTKCSAVFDLDAEIFAGATPPLCSLCEEVNEIRTNHEGKRSHGIGRLRPRMVLYHDHNPDEEAIGSVMKEDLRRRPDAVIVVGTSMKIPGVRRIVREMCGLVRDRKDGGLAIWINRDLPPVAGELKDCFDVVVQSSCDELADRAAMRKWDDSIQHDVFSEVSDEDADKARAKQAEVHVPTTPSRPECELTHANLELLSSEKHINNSYPPPGLASTPKKGSVCSPLWSPLPSRTQSIMPSIEHRPDEADNITLANLPTPVGSRKSTSQRSSPGKKLASINEKLKDAAKSITKPSTAKAAKSNITAAPKPVKKSNVKYVKPATSKAKPKPKAKTKPQPGPKATAITTTFTQSKSVSVSGKNSAKKALLSPIAKSPSKLRQVSQMAELEGPGLADTSSVLGEAGEKEPMTNFLGAQGGVKRKAGSS